MILFQSIGALAVACSLIMPCGTARAWSVGEAGGDSAGWVLDDNGHKFFAIGLWGIPGYSFTRSDDEPSGNEQAFAEQTAPFNLVVTQSGYQKPYMFRPGTVLMAGWSEFNWALTEKGYTGDIPLRESGRQTVGIPFERMQAIRSRIGELSPYIRRTVVEQVREAFPVNGLIHFIADEPDRGHGGWFWPPELIQAYRDIVRDIAPGQLTYMDFGGTISANLYFYEQLFGPVMKTGTDPSRGECDPRNMDTYDYAYDGTPLYEHRTGGWSGGTWVQKPDSVFTRVWFENVSRTSRAYRNSSDIAGVNSYRVFRDYPETAGETVDAIRNGCGSGKPVWHFYDASAVSKPRDMSYGDYFALVRCQMYTSIIHGATGVLFYAFDLDRTATREYWPLLRGLARTFETQRELFELPETGHSWDTAYHSPGYNHIHYSIRSDGMGVRVLIVSNTDCHEPHTVKVEGFPNVELPPLGVAVVSARGINRQDPPRLRRIPLVTGDSTNQVRSFFVPLRTYP